MTTGTGGGTGGGTPAPRPRIDNPKVGTNFKPAPGKGTTTGGTTGGTGGGTAQGGTGTGSVNNAANTGSLNVQALTNDKSQPSALPTTGSLAPGSYVTSSGNKVTVGQSSYNYAGMTPITRTTSGDTVTYGSNGVMVSSGGKILGTYTENTQTTTTQTGGTSGIVNALNAGFAKQSVQDQPVASSIGGGYILGSGARVGDTITASFGTFTGSAPVRKYDGLLSSISMMDTKGYVGKIYASTDSEQFGQSVSNVGKSLNQAADQTLLYTPKDVGSTVGRNIMEAKLRTGAVALEAASVPFSVGAGIKKVSKNPIMLGESAAIGAGMAALPTALAGVGSLGGPVGSAVGYGIGVGIDVTAGAYFTGKAAKELSESGAIAQKTSGELVFDKVGGRQAFYNVATEQAANIAVAGGAAKFTSMSIPFKATESIVKPKLVVVGEEYAGVSFESGTGKSAGMIGVTTDHAPTIEHFGTTGGIVKGVPTIDVSRVDFSEGVQISTLGESKIYEKNIPELTKQLSSIREVQQRALFSPYKLYSEEISTRTLNPEGNVIVSQFNIREGGVDYGSAVSTLQLPEGANTLGRVPGDRDVQFDISTEKLLPKAQWLVNTLSDAGNPVVLSRNPQSPLLVEVEGGKGHAVDIHASDTLNRDIGGVTPDRFMGMSLNQPTKTLSYGLEIQQLNENMLRKGSSISTLRYDEKGNIVARPEAHRMKDVQDFITFTTQELKKKGIAADDPVWGKLKEIESYYPKDTTIAEAKPLVRTGSKGRIGYETFVGSSASIGATNYFGRRSSFSTSKIIEYPSRSFSMTSPSTSKPSPSTSIPSLPSPSPSFSTSTSTSISYSFSGSRSAPSPSMPSPSIPSSSRSRGIPSEPPSLPPLPPTGLPNFAPPSASFGGLGKSKQQLFKYAPSITSLSLGIRGKQQKGSLSPFNVRPIVGKRGML